MRNRIFFSFFLLCIASSCFKDTVHHWNRLKEIVFVTIPDKNLIGETWDQDLSPPDIYLYFGEVKDTSNSWHSAGMFEDVHTQVSQKFHSSIQLTDEPWVFNLYDNDSHDFTNDQLMKTWVLNPKTTTPLELNGDGYLIKILFEEIPQE